LEEKIMKHTRRFIRLLFAIGIAVFTLGMSEIARAQTWIELSPTGSPPDPIYVPKPVHYDATNNRLIVFFPGNPPYGGFGNQVWVLTNANGLGGTPAWIQLSPSGSPPFTNGQASVVYDAATNRLIVYGGCFANCSPALNNVFVLSNANGLGGPPVWTQSTVSNPQARVGHSSVYDSANNLLLSFAGQLAFFGTNQNDTRIFSNANGVASPSTWTTLATTGGPPPIRDEHTAVYDQANNRMTVFAGEKLITTCCPYVISDYNDTWVLANANGQSGTPTWAQLLPAGPLPSVRKGHSAIYDSMNNRMLVFGGRVWNQTAQTEPAIGDLWQLSNANGLGGTPTWTQLTQSGALPGPRFYHAAAFDEANQRMIVLGGRDSTDTPSNRVWVLSFNQAPVAVCQNVTVTADAGCTADASINNGSFDPDGDALTITQSPAGPYPLGMTSVTLTVTDSKGASSQCMATVTVNNPAPTVTINSPASGAVFPVGTPVNFTGSFTDNPGTHTATWMFDTLTQAGTVNEMTGAVSASYTFTTAGVYKVKLTVDDVCGEMGTATTVGGFDALVVVYDPNGGFVTGGGWITSPAGAYTPNLSLTGKANFGFVSKYQKGASVPTGQTEFQFKVANFNFQSTSYDWLVIAGARAQYKGTGTINGAGSYSFLLTAIDGQISGGGGSDKFRIKIWDAGGVVYDNQMGAGDNDNPTTVLGGGSIVIHK
jgi:hypothetical protein